ncbi:hypothetical protein EHE19_019265 [Ruminiclostridium herbifermentans]|uniref:Uncharacterized protein n=1 Tax=Ruminiclostridium herbifermentans TaxID=2488810 RepID=A0A7H1VNH3_9FIRM|nr:hypothetical protein [Ruminiclostridium herbifermentans]QNU66935.1 hypothetical protein EHE19_019265 [Ruminiclostridium herbifermentans]
MGCNKNWTQSEIERLRDLWGSKTIPQIAKIMGRSQNAITVKSKRIGLGAFKDHSEYMPALQVSKLLGIDIHTITDYWIPRLGLPFKHIAPRGKKEFTYIRISSLITWLKNNPDRWDSRRVELYAFGSEPEWLKQKRKNDSANKPKGCIKWTPQEDAKLIYLYRQGEKIKDIADKLGRSLSGVEHRVARLDVWGSGAYIGNNRQNERKKNRRAFEHKALEARLIATLKTRFNQLNWDGFWQKDICMNWNPVKGCTSGEINCDECSSFIRMKPQYCKRCGGTFYSRQIQDICDLCKKARKKQYQKKWAVLNKRT